MPYIPVNQSYKKHKGLKQAAKILRNKQTPYEKILWNKIKNKKICNINFHRQQVLLNSYIVDFYAPKVKLVIETDGAQHDLMENKENDRMRDQMLMAVNITVKRYSNLMIHNEIEYIIRDLQNYIWQKLHIL